MTTSTTPAARTQAEATTSSPAGHQEDQEDGEDASLELTHIPWDVVGSYLGLRDVLNVRLVSSSLALHMDDQFGYPQCSTWLHDELVRRSVHVFNDTRQWKRARIAPPPRPSRASRRHGGDLDVDDDDDDVLDDDCLLRWLVRSQRLIPGRPTTTTPGTGACASLDDVPHPQQNSQGQSTPFNLLLRCLRVVRYLPQQLTVAYSGKYGRHGWGLAFDHSSVIQYPGCHRRDGNNHHHHCVTCRTRIETVPMATATTTTSSSDRPNGSDDVVTIDMTLQIPVGTTKKNISSDKINNNAAEEPRPEEKVEHRRCVRLDTYHSKCIPNLPSDLVCPVCRVSDRRTLVLAELSYQTEPGTERIASSHHRSFTFTPAQDNDEDEDDDDEGPPRRKRRRMHQDADGAAAGAEVPDIESPFPPRYRESFLYRYYEDNHAMDIKHAVSIHCDNCRQFGVFSPAQLGPLEGWGRTLEEGRDPSMHHVLFSSAFLQRAPPQNNDGETKSRTWRGSETASRSRARS